jgi:hypothetical protein
MKTKMIASRSFRYGTRQLSSGQEFEARRQDARLLNALGRAKEAPPVRPGPSSKGQPDSDKSLDAKQVVSQQEEVLDRKDAKSEREEQPEKPAKKKRAYKRRDLRSED